MKIAVIVADATSMVNTGADVERRYREFELPPEIEKFIRGYDGAFASVSFALRDEDARG